METIIAFPAMLYEYRTRNSLTMEQLAEKIGKTKSTISKWESGTRSPKIYEIEEIAHFFKISPQMMMFGENTAIPTEASNTTVEAIKETVVQLPLEQQKNVLDYTRGLLETQKAKRKPKIIAETPTIEYKVFFRSYTKAGPTGFGYDDYTDENTDFVYVSEEPPRHDIATLVNGDSMNPDYQDGDILYLRDYGASYYSGEECVVVINDKSYFKKIYTTEDGLRLVSTNPDKETYPDLYIDFPPTDGTHIKIFNVVGSDKPIG